MNKVVYIIGLQNHDLDQKYFFHGAPYACDNGINDDDDDNNDDDDDADVPCKR